MTRYHISSIVLMAERLYVYNAKVSIRSRLEILQTIRAKLSWKEDRLDIFSRTVFGPWLNIQTTLHDNHLLNFLLQHQRFISKPSTNQPFIFDIDGRTLEYGREDFCLITGFRFGKVNLDPDEEDHSEFRMRVFPKTENLKGEHLLELVNKDVKFAKLDDEDVVRVCLMLALDFVFMGHELRHVVSKPIVNLVDDFYIWDAFPWGEYMWTFLHKRVYNVAVTRRKFHLEKLASNPKYEANYVLYGFVFPLKTFSTALHWWRKDKNVIPRGVAWSNGLKFEKSILRSTTKGSSKGKSVHTRVQTETRHEVHVHIEVSRVHSKEEMIFDLQLRLNPVEEKLKPGSLDVDHLDKTDNLSKNAPDCGLDQQSMGGVSQCMNVDEPYKSVEGVNQCTGLNDEYKGVAVDDLISLWSLDVGHISKSRTMKKLVIPILLNGVFDTPSVQVQDACISELLDVVKDDVNVNSVVKEEIVKDDVNVNSLVKEDIEKDDVKPKNLNKRKITKIPLM
ncbi:phospholipase-like protein [Tanacetum coccineum]|uniref:Phospholipase-like protein n=1 Tax=Tanacetum coccineum TaxID=301880 RepID=A0ABQ5CK45_9ASTR